jgi:hypothetical protein
MSRIIGIGSSGRVEVPITHMTRSKRQAFPFDAEARSDLQHLLCFQLPSLDNWYITLLAFHFHAQGFTSSSGHKANLDEYGTLQASVLSHLQQHVLGTLSILSFS